MKNPNKKNKVNEYKKMQDNELVFLYIQEEKEQAINVLLEKYTNILRINIQSVIKDPDTAEDVLQEVYAKITQALKQGKYKEQSKFKSWASSIARNTAKDYWRKLKNKKEFTSRELSHPENTDNDEEVLEKEAEKSMEFFQSEPLLTDDEIRFIRGLINQLPPLQKEVLILHLYNELKFEEIARILNENLNTVLGRNRYAKNGLRKKMQKDPLGRRIIKKLRKPNLHDS